MDLGAGFARTLPVYTLGTMQLDWTRLDGNLDFVGTPTKLSAYSGCETQHRTRHGTLDGIWTDGAKLPRMVVYCPHCTVRYRYRRMLLLPAPELMQFYGTVYNSTVHQFTVN